MKRTILMLLSLAMLSFLCCPAVFADEEPKEDAVIADNRTRPAEGTAVVDNRARPEEEAPVEVTDDDFDIVTYPYIDSDDVYLFMVVTNNSAAAVSIDGEGSALDADGNQLAAADLEPVRILGPGETTLTYYKFADLSEGAVRSVDSRMTYNTEPIFSPILSDLSVSQTLNNENVIVTVANNSESCASFVRVWALFLDENGSVFSYDAKYAIDMDDEIKPGASISVELDCSEYYEDVVVCLTGKSDGKPYEALPAVDPSDFACTEYAFGEYYYVAVKNNSDVTVWVDGNATAIAKGFAVGADDFDDIYVLGPGEESLSYFQFKKASDYDTVDYTLTYSTEVSYRPALSDISVDMTEAEDRVTVTVTNNGSKAAFRLKANVLFFDEDGNVAACGSASFTGSDGLRPGESAAKEIRSYASFDHALVYLTGHGPITD